MATDITAPAPDAPDQFADIHDPLSREAQSLEILAELAGDETETATEAGGPPATPQPEPDPAADPSATAGTQQTAEETAVEAPATPLTFTVDGKEHTQDGIQVIPGKGATISEDALPKVRDLLAQGEKRWSDNQDLYKRVTEYETLTFKDRAGTEHKGRHAFENMYIEHAKQNAALELLAKTVSNADTLAGLLTYDQTSGKFLLNDGAVAQLQREIGLTARETEYSARNKFGEQAQRATQETQVETLRTEALTKAFTNFRTQFPALTAKDWEAAQSHFTRLANYVVRPATPQEAQQAGVAPGSHIIDLPLMYGWLSERETLRKEAAAAATAAQSTNKENASRLAAANAGKKAPQQRRAAPATTPARSKSDEWEEQKARLQSGQWSADD